MSGDTWLSRFQQHLIRQDLAEISIEGYLADLHHFFHWLADWHDCSVDLVTVADIRTYRQYLVNSKRQKPASVNRRLQALRHSPLPPTPTPSGSTSLAVLSAWVRLQHQSKDRRAMSGRNWCSPPSDLTLPSSGRLTAPLTSNVRPQHKNDCKHNHQESNHRRLA